MAMTADDMTRNDDASAHSAMARLITTLLGTRRVFCVTGHFDIPGIFSQRTWLWYQAKDRFYALLFAVGHKGVQGFFFVVHYGRRMMR